MQAWREPHSHGDTKSQLKALPDRYCELYSRTRILLVTASICGLGQTAASAVESALAKFPVFGPGGAR